LYSAGSPAQRELIGLSAQHDDDTGAVPIWDVYERNIPATFTGAFILGDVILPVDRLWWC
jgi:hypothetical protein